MTIRVFSCRYHFNDDCWPDSSVGIGYCYSWICVLQEVRMLCVENVYLMRNKCQVNGEHWNGTLVGGV